TGVGGMGGGCWEHPWRWVFPLFLGRARRAVLFAPPLRRKIVAECAEGEAAEILAQPRRYPSLAAVARHLDRADPVAAVPGDAADGNRSLFHVRAVRRIGD